ncbi:piggyBac transposable element-derived protein 4-like [Hydra vulgaris]|uniref:piggyBac transposable element-derived protein 4-like n=1 Tax=Hydra vulgaris TaxID=6087 RepID=UPI0032EA13A9
MLGQTGPIVLDLMEKFLEKGYLLYTDNFFNSFELTKHMISQSTYKCGTLRTDRKSNAKECTKAKLKRGDVISREGVVVAKWKDKRDVLMISNLHSLQMIEVTNRRGEKKMKPNILKAYNQYMSGVDKADQMFRELVVTDLLGDRLHEIVPRITNNSLHYLSSIPPNEKKKLPTKPCRVCSKIKRKETRYECAVCENRPPLCILYKHLPNHKKLPNYAVAKAENWLRLKANKKLLQRELSKV